MQARVQAAVRWMGLTETNAARTQALVVSSDAAVEAEFKDVISAKSRRASETGQGYVPVRDLFPS